jgi:hypothetical protein
MSKLDLARGIRKALESHGWTAKEGAAHSLGVVDVAARRSFERKRISYTSHLLAICHSGEVSFSPEQATASSIAMYWLGLDDREQRRALIAALGEENVAALHRAAYPKEKAIVTSVAAPKVKAHAAAGNVPESAFRAIEGVLRDLFAYDLDVLQDGVEPDVRQCHLVQAVVVTEQELAPVRVHRPFVVGADERWVDVVGAASFEDYVARLTK